MTDLTKTELFDLALGICSGAVFTDRHIDNTNGEGGKVMSHIFMPLLYIDYESLETLLAEADLIYEWVSRAFSEVDGYPSFTSMQWLNKADAAWVWEQVELILSYRPEEEEQDAETDTA